jgi:3-deoxy-manno-octulosonate cytidylyltransferase (CMP-KDO synthetase)
MTSADHTNGTARVGEAADAINAGADDIVVNVQGDEPELEPHVLDAAVNAMLHDPACVISTPAAPFGDDEDIRDPAAVKVVCARDGAALYFSRSVIPFDRDGDAGADARPLRHIGLYCYRRPFLREYLSWSPTPLENAEKLEQLRVLEHGKRIAMAICETSSRGGIDTRAQYEAFVRRWNARKH